LELSKAVLQSDSAGAAAKRGTRSTLINTLEVLLRALHPIAPFISEEIWQRVRVSAGVTGDTIMRCAFPTAAAVKTDPQAEPEMRWVIDFIEGVRQIRSGMDIAPSRKLEVLLQNATPRDAEYLGRNLHFLVRVAGIEPPRTLGEAQVAPISAVAFVGALEILVPMAGLIDPAAELARLTRLQNKVDMDLKKLEGKLSNADFAKNAPPEIVAKDELRLAELRTEMGLLSAQIARVNALKGQ
jgi:valyl-tRNA synthetase